MKDKNNKKKSFTEVLKNALMTVIGAILVLIMLYVLYFVLPSASEVGEEIFKPLNKPEVPHSGAPWNSPSSDEYKE